MFYYYLSNYQHDTTVFLDGTITIIEMTLVYDKKEHSRRNNVCDKRNEEWKNNDDNSFEF